MGLLLPQNGEVIRYAYLWRHETLQGRDEASKDRPVVVAFAVAIGGRPGYIVVPITTKAPSPGHGIEIPDAARRQLRLDGDRNWIITTEVNEFVWPGPDIRPFERDGVRTISYGFLPAGLVRSVQEAIRMRWRDAHFARTPRN